MNERVKQIRKIKGLTQAEFADKLGIRQQAVAKIESSHAKLTEQNIKLICNEFSVNEEWLRTGDGEIFDVTPKKEAVEQLKEEYSLTDTEMNFIEKYLSWSPEKRISFASFY